MKTIIILLSKTSRLEGIGRVGSPAPMFIELGTSLVKAVLWWGMGMMG